MWNEYLFYWLFFVEEQKWKIRVVFLSEISISLGKKSKKVKANISNLKYIATGNMGTGKPFGFFSFSAFGFGVQWDKKS